MSAVKVYTILSLVKIIEQTPKLSLPIESMGHEPLESDRLIFVLE